LISLDLETTGLDIYKGSANPFFFSITNEDLETTTWEFDVNPLNREPEIPKEDLIEIRDVIQNADQIIIQNAIFDGSVLIEYYRKRGVELGWDWSKIRDTLYAAHLLCSNEPKDLTTLCVKYLGRNISRYEKELETSVKECRNLARSKDFGETVSNKWYIAHADDFDMPSVKQKTWKADLWLPKAMHKTGYVTRETNYNTILASYAEVDSVCLIPLYKEQMRQIEERGLQEIYNEKLKLLPIVETMQREGITISKKRTDSLMQDLEGLSTVLEMTCESIANRNKQELQLPKSGNNHSLLNFSAHLLKKANYKQIPKTATGQLSLTKETIKHFSEIENDDCQRFFSSLLKKRSTDTAINYLNGYRKFWSPVNPKRGVYVMHPNLNVTGTNTLRWSSSNPNEQNISKKGEPNLRYCFGPKPGRVWFSLDAKNIELRIPAYESGERDLIDLFEASDKPPFYGSNHLLNFSVVYPEIWDEAIKIVGLKKAGEYCKSTYVNTYYQWCKNGGFAIQYGAQDKADGTGTADRAFHKPGAHALLKERFSKLEVLNQKCINQAKKTGYVTTMPDKSIGAKTGYPLVCTKTKWGAIMPTVPLSYHVQGTAMYWMQKAMIRCYRFLEFINSLKGTEKHLMVAQVHDELIFDFPRDKTNKETIQEIKSLMEEGGNDLGIPTPVSISYHPNNWMEEREYKIEDNN